MTQNMREHQTDMRRLQKRYNSAHARAYTRPTPEVVEAQRKFENGLIEIEEFEAFLDRCDGAAQQ